MNYSEDSEMEINTNKSEFSDIKLITDKHFETQQHPALPGNLEGGSCTVPTGLLPLGRLSAGEQVNKENIFNKIILHTDAVYSMPREVRGKDLIFNLNTTALREPQWVDVTVSTS